MNEIQEEISSFEPGVFEPTRRTLVRFEFEEEESLEYQFETIAAPVVTDNYDYGPPDYIIDPTPIRVTKVSFYLTTSSGVTADVTVTLDGIGATFNGGSSTLSIVSNTYQEFTADPGQVVANDILWGVTVTSANDLMSDLDMVLYGLFP